MSDFVPFYLAANTALETPARIYDIESQHAYESQLVGTDFKTISYVFPPYSLLFYVPFAKLPIGQAFSIWKWITIFSTAALLVVFATEGICIKLHSLLITTILLITSIPWIGTLNNGQPTIVATLGILLGYILVRNNKYWLASVLFILVSFKPQMVIVPYLYLSIIYGWALLRPIIIISAITFTICTFIFGFGIWGQYIHSLLYAPYTLSSYDINHIKMINIRAVLLYFFSEEHFYLVNILSSSIWVMSIAATIVLAIKTRKSSPAAKELGFALAVVISCPFSPYLWIMSAVIQILAIGYLLKYGSRITPYLIIVSLLFLLFISLIYFADFPIVNTISYVFAQIVLLLALLRLLIKYHQPPMLRNLEVSQIDYSRSG